MAEKDYKVTAGDVYTLSFYQNGAGASYTIIVDSTYKIKIANLGAINCENLSFIQLKKNIETLVMRNYPLSVVTFAMLQPSVFNVFIKGEFFFRARNKGMGFNKTFRHFAGRGTYTIFFNPKYKNQKSRWKNKNLRPVQGKKKRRLFRKSVLTPRR